jgi:glycosyltransferase involved in cell wall biosynthesis
MEATLITPPAVARPPRPDPGPFLAVSHDAGRTGAPIGLLAFLRWRREQTGRPVPSILRAPGPLAPDFAALGPCLVLRNTWLHRTRAGRRLLGRLPRAVADETGRVLKFARLHQPGVVYSNTLTNGRLLADLAPLGVPAVSHAHELEYWIARLGPENLRLTLQHSHHFIAAAEAVARNLRTRHGVDPSQLTVIHEHIARLPAPWNPDTRARERQRLGLPPEAFVIGSCGAEHWRKGRDLIPNLLRAVQRRLPERAVRFLWIGRPGSADEERALNYDLRLTGGAAAYVATGELPDPFPSYSALDAFALLSRDDPFPLACLEAAAAGAPVLCFDDAGGMPEFTARGAGLSVPYLDVEAMADGLARIARETEFAGQLARTARGEVAERHLPMHTGPRILEVLARTRASGPQV